MGGRAAQKQPWAQSLRSSKDPGIHLKDKYNLDDWIHCGKDGRQFTKIESGFEMKSLYTCGYWFIRISVFRYIGNIGLFHKDPVCSFHFRLEAVLARVRIKESMKFTRRPIVPDSWWLFYWKYNRLVTIRDQRVPDTRPEIFFNTRSVPDSFSKSSGISGIGY